ncbi:response regulator transcription factor [Streptomyces sp. NPDC058417]|uniref:helix-turn-helix transcriptional regulator n=1 Tax=unclassified Streptomyces TaxID=2593676 RepID=UPI003660FE47
MTADTAGTAEMRGALARLRRATGLPVAFGGLVEPGRPRVRISELSGAGTPALRGLAVTSGNGLGGKAVALARPCAVTDYSRSRRISHEYDTAVAQEGLRSVLAVPVVVRRRVRGVLYGALRTAEPLGDRALTAAVAVARDVEQALVAADEVRALLAAARPGGHPALPARTGVHPEAYGWPGGSVRPPDGSVRTSPVPGGAGPVGGWEQVRAAHAALRALAPRITDPALRAELESACGLLTPGGWAPQGAGPGGAGPVGAGPGGGLPGDGLPGGPAPGVTLAPRELDVLACVAAGATNAAAGARLGLRAETVKGYLRSAMRKLGARTRGEAVVSARRAGLLP